MLELKYDYDCERDDTILVSYISYVYSKQPIFGLAQEWFRELSFSRLECGVHAKCCCLNTTCVLPVEEGYLVFSQASHVKCSNT